MSGLDDLSPGELRAMLREHALILAPGEVLIVQVPPDWPPRDIRNLQAALRCYCCDTEYGLGADIAVLVVPGTAVTVAQMPADPFGEG